MAGAMHRMGVYLGLVEEDDYEAEGAYANGAERAADRADRAERAPARRDDYAEARAYAPRQPVAYARQHDYHDDGYAEVHEEPAPTYQITALHPRTYNEARTIGEHFRKSTPVIMNLSDMDDADAKRLVDFAAGLTFGLHGRIERVTAKVFLLSPQNVTVTASDKAKIENGFFNQS
jgi:cell division inhibitor SepF